MDGKNIWQASYRWRLQPPWSHPSTWKLTCLLARLSGDLFLGSVLVLPLLAEQPWARYSSSPRLSFLRCEMARIIVPTPLGCCEVKTMLKHRGRRHYSPLPYLPHSYSPKATMRIHCALLWQHLSTASLQAQLITSLRILKVASYQKKKKKNLLNQSKLV